MTPLKPTVCMKIFVFVLFVFFACRAQRCVDCAGCLFPVSYRLILPFFFLLKDFVKQAWKASLMQKIPS